MTTRAILELTTTIQPGDLLLFSDGTQHYAASYPKETDKRAGSWWMVSVKTSWGRMPTGLSGIARVTRNNVVIWDISNERLPVQRSLI